MSENMPLPENSQPEDNLRPAQAPAGVFPRIRDISLRARLVLVITLLTSMAVLILGYFGYARAQQTQTFLHDQLQSNVGKQAEYQLQSTALMEANQLNQYFSAITDALRTEASYFQNLQKRSDLFDAGLYWNAPQKLRHLSGGQWGNPSTDPASVLVPSTVNLDDAKITAINSYMYLDFFAPELLKEKSGIIATYFIDTDGVSVYYPNTDLANSVGDFNATSQPFYQIATPENDPQRLPVWTTPYQDPAKNGLIVTNSMPVYDQQDHFLGVMGVDVQLSAIATQISTIKVGSSGYAFLIDSAGHILVLPRQGYTDFGMTAISVPVGQPIQQSVLGQGPEALQAITKKMVAGQNGIETASINGKAQYVGFASLPSVNYSLGVAAPTSELNAAFFSAETELANQTRQTINTTLILMAIILLVIGFISWFIGRQLTNPLIDLTSAAQAIAAGDLLVTANANSNNEIGSLGKAFNKMTAQLRDSISTLETRVAERTGELSIVNEKNQGQATQLRAIAEIARSAANLKRLDDLLPEITQRISATFGFYHVGIFLLDANREYAVLKAANSETGLRMISRSYHLKVGELGIVGYVTLTGQPRIALDIGENAEFFSGPDLSETRSELALPLRAGDEIIGALDIQSSKAAAFTNNDLDTFGLLADQISVAIENARLFEETRIALQEAQNIYTQSALASWREINRQSAVAGYRYANGAVEPLRRDDAPDVPASVSALEDVATVPTRGNETLSVPIIFRGENLGALNIRQPGRTQVWSDAETRLYQSIVERLSFALENARLYVDAQKRASKERIIGEIGSKISGSVNLDNILQIVVEELGRTLPGSEVIVQFEEGSPSATAEKGSAQ